jgi:UDP-N-acetylmuramoylalanine--D-glutamate ligase
LPHRLEIVSRRGGVAWVNDSQATIPDAAIRALDSFPPPVTLIAGGRAKLDDADSYRRLGAAIAAHAATLITIGEDAETIAAAARAAGFAEGDIVAAGTLDAAVAIAADRTPPGGAVLLSPACASFDQFKDYEARGFAFKNSILALPNGA